MANVAVTNTFVAGTSAVASQVNTNFSDIVTWLNNRNAGTDTWGQLKITATVANPVIITSSAATTEVSIDNTATDGDPLLTFKFSGSTAFTIGADDTDDFLKFATTALTTNVAMQIPSGGTQVQFNAGLVGTPSISFIGDADTGMYWIGQNNVGLSIGGTKNFDFNAAGLGIGGVAPTSLLHLQLPDLNGNPFIKFTRFGVSTWDFETGNAGDLVLNSDVTTKGFYIESVGQILAYFLRTGVSIQGTTTNDNASAGYVGELQGTNIATGSAVTLDAGSGTFKNITSISLTAGDWDVCGVVAVKLNGAGGNTYVGGAVSLYTGGTTTDHTVAVNVVHGVTPGATDIVQDTFNVIPKYRLALSGSSTVYLKAIANYSSGNLKAYGSIYARRVR